MKYPAGKQTHDERNHRISVTLEPEQYEHLHRVAEQKKVSLAWVMRDAVERMLKEEMPLFRSNQS